DPHAEVRAAAAHRLGELGGASGAGGPGALEPWLLGALGGGSALGRGGILRAPPRARAAAALPGVPGLGGRDGVWWARRAAGCAPAASGGAAEAPELTRALADPFWRVRQAAVKVLAVLGARDPDVRDEVTAAEATPAVTFLRGTWGPVAIEAPARAASA